MNRRDFFKGIGGAVAVGAASVSVLKEKPALEPQGPVTVNAATSTTLPRTENITTEEGPFKIQENLHVGDVVGYNVINASYVNKFKTQENVHVGDVVEVNESHEVQKCRRGSIPVGVVVGMETSPDGTKECKVAVHGYLGLKCK